MCFFKINMDYILRVLVKLYALGQLPSTYFNLIFKCKWHVVGIKVVLHHFKLHLEWQMAIIMLQYMDCGAATILMQKCTSSST